MTQFRTIDQPPGFYAAARAPLRRYAPPAELLSQMLQQRHRTAPQPARVAEAAAMEAYAYTAKAAVIRMPAGYRRSLVV